MPRKATQKPSEDMTKNSDAKALAAATKKADKLNKQLAEIDAAYGDGSPYDPARLINETRFYLNQSAESLLEAGRRLVVLKEHEPHGGFAEALVQIGLAPRAARKTMQAAVKFSGAKRPALAVLGKTKLLELMIEDDEDLSDLAEGGTLAGHTLDEIECMTTRELQKALRKEREKRERDKATNEKQLASKDKKLNAYDKRVQDLETRTRPWPEHCLDINKEITVCAFEAMKAFDRLNTLRDVVLLSPLELELEKNDMDMATEQMAVVYYDAIEQLVGQVVELSQACNEVFFIYKNKSQSLLAQGAEALKIVNPVK